MKRLICVLIAVTLLALSVPAIPANATVDYKYAPMYRANMAYILWEMSGFPEPEREDNPFSDIYDDDFYYKAVLWAAENGIVSGTSANVFKPLENMTRYDVCKCLFLCFGDGSAGGNLPYTDISRTADYYDAVAWAEKTSWVVTNADLAENLFKPSYVVHHIKYYSSGATRFFELLTSFHETVKTDANIFCDKPGNPEYYTCTICGALSIYPNCSLIYEEKDLCIPGYGHFYGGSYTPSGEPDDDRERPSGTYVCSSCGETVDIEFPRKKGNFYDIELDDYYFLPVLWAVKNKVTEGMTDTGFSPESVCTRGQIATFLWRFFATGEENLPSNEFVDVSESDYFFKAVLWALGKSITDGTGEDTFSPGAGCTRAQTVTFLWRASGCPEPSSSENPFEDVSESDYFYKAVLWAVENRITDGTSETTFSPGLTCTRGQIVTFLFRCSVRPDLCDWNAFCLGYDYVTSVLLLFTSNYEEAESSGLYAELAAANLYEYLHTVIMLGIETEWEGILTNHWQSDRYVDVSMKGKDEEDYSVTVVGYIQPEGEVIMFPESQELIISDFISSHDQVDFRVRPREVGASVYSFTLKTAGFDSLRFAID